MKVSLDIYYYTSGHNKCQPFVCPNYARFADSEISKRPYIALAIWMALGVFAGRWLDHHGFTAPWGLLLGVFAGVAGCIYTILRTLKKLDKQA